MNSFHISQQAHREILDYLGQSKKIAAIKTLRRETKCDLRSAKYAIERIEHEKFGKNYPSALAEGLRIYSAPKIKKLILDYGQGDIEVDLESMQMITLMEMQTTGLDVCREMLSFIDILKSYSEGKKIGVIDDVPEESDQ